ncbi:FAD-dependent oxidoreductase [Microbacterium sp. NPDC055903]
MTSLWRLHAASPLGTPFEPGARHEAVVVGAGLTGLSTALTLARAGMDVAVIDAGELGALASGGNTGKLSLLQGDRLAAIRRHHPAALVRAYVDANRDGAEWLTGFADSAGIPYTRRTDHAYAQGAGGIDAVHRQHAAAREAGLATRMPAPGALDVPFPVAAAVALDQQVAIDPMQVVCALAAAAVDAGATLHTGVRAHGIRSARDPRVETALGPIHGRRIVLATGTAIVDRGLTFAKTRGLRSSCIAFRIPADPPRGMFLSVDDPTRSIRPVSYGDGPAQEADLVVGGAGHPVGRSSGERAGLDELVAWTRRHFPDAVEVSRWSAQDYESHNLIPFVGALPRGLGRIRFATGYAKWGLSNAPAAALRLTAEILGTPRRSRPGWMGAIGTRMTRPADLVRGAAEGLRTARWMAVGWAGAEVRPVPVPRPAEGRGVIANRAGRAVAVSTVDGVTTAIDGRCSHLGGVVSWNDAECTWDCPLHASRFAPDGTRIEGPAVRDLERLA